MKILLLVIATLLISACSENKVTQSLPSKTLYANANIYTLDEHLPWANAMVVDNGQIVYVGNNEAAKQYIDHDTLTIDLNGKFVMPGFVDGHTHPGLVGIFEVDEQEDISEYSLPQDSNESLYKFLQQYADKYWYQPVIVLGSWDVNSFLPEGPNKAKLDEIFPWRPVILMDNSGHSFWANSSALWLMGIDKDTPDISKDISYFVRDKHGEPTGWIKEFAMLPYLGNMLLPSNDQLKDNIVNFLNFLSSKGVTTLLDAGNFDWDDEIYTIIAELDQAGELPVRYEGAYHIWSPDQLGTAIEQFKELRRKYSGPRLNFNTIKIHYDGVLELETAAMLDPFISTKKGTANHRGGILFTAQVLSEFIEQLNEEGIHLHMHTDGDRATREALNAIELVRTKNNNKLDIEITLSHLEVVAPTDIDRFKAPNIHANFTPHWFGGTHFGNAGGRNIGPERASRSQVAGHFVEKGANVTLSSDVTSQVETKRANPFVGLQMSVTRHDYTSGEPAISTQPASASLSLVDAIAAYTINGARQLGLKKQLGSLIKGKNADFIILEQNPFEVDINKLHQLQPHAVLLEGEIVFGELITKTE